MWPASSPAAVSRDDVSLDCHAVPGSHCALLPPARPRSSCHHLLVLELMLLAWRQTGSYLWVEREMKEIFHLYFLICFVKSMFHFLMRKKKT